MATAPVPDIQPGVISAGPPQAGSPDLWMAELGTLLKQLDGTLPAQDGLAGSGTAAGDDQLAKRRLGIAGSLYAALQCKHEATAAHSMRVALTCSAWAATRDMDERGREQLEIAALLHDVGVIGAPDRILLKPGRLDADEVGVMLRSRAMGLEILRRSCSSTEILAIVEYATAWYDGSRGRGPLCGEQLPLAARMIAVAEAYDAMTSDHVYRAAMSQERATAELFRCAGTQFDPQLVEQFVELERGDRTRLFQEVADRWLLALDPRMANCYWDFQGGSPAMLPGIDPVVFQAKLLENMYDAVIFVDARGQVTLWNHGAERLTGIAGANIRQKQWHPMVLNLIDEKGQPITDDDCPVLSAIRSGVQSLRRLTLWGRNERCVAVDSHTVPVIADNGNTQGAIVLLHDASSETSLEQRCQSLAEKATRDPLTQVANRAEFDRVHVMFVAAHQQQHIPCSLLMCDLDNFKAVNDTHGHQAGDEAIKSLAALLKGACRPGDLVARYGGEEFVMLCADCDNATASRRAEHVRNALAQMPQPKMGDRTVTVSFGVTEVQPGDTPETMLRRADRALLTAKQNGRNRVVQLGTGASAKPEEAGGGWFRHAASAEPTTLVEQTLVTPVPLQMAIEKLRGFVADHEARILNIDGNQVQLEISERSAGPLRRLTDRPVIFQLHLRLEEQRMNGKGDSGPAGGVLRTRIKIAVSLRRNRDRRRKDVVDRARQVLTSFRSYLMAIPEEQDRVPQRGALGKVKNILPPWLGGG
ncbi:MAG: diguanylate cyclase [Thermoguttaceae bacterium]|jgi:diguanylate cyclase (GGDEF)-like protein